MDTSLKGVPASQTGSAVVKGSWKARTELQSGTFQTLLKQAAKEDKSQKAPPFSRLTPTTLKTIVTQLSAGQSTTPSAGSQHATHQGKKALTDEQSAILSIKTTLLAERERYSGKVQKLANPKDPLLVFNLLRL
ncbi:hypothetical protein [Kosakonia sp.]|uniref:hypothetical protein n=1 Tax=Kosakonia sp. TaxID=1916651 RepID=UPI00289FF6CA|nr:hypothetical protein [Kosakonia sp.]